MNFSLFFAKRSTFGSTRKVSGLVVALAIVSIALAVAVMEIAASFVRGFELEIQNKVAGFGSHILVRNYMNLNEEEHPIPNDTAFLAAVSHLPYVAAAAPYGNISCIVSAKGGKAGALLKGVDSSYDWRFMRSVLIAGEVPDFRSDNPSRDVLISNMQARSLGLQPGDRLTLYVLDDPPRRRPARVAGIYETGMEEFDLNIMLCDLRVVQQLQGWDSLNLVSGFEVNLNSLEHIEAASTAMNELDKRDAYELLPITRLYAEVFDWLRLQHQNVLFIVVLMMIVAVINMTTVILILVIERTRSIGVLKALGMRNFQLQTLFVWNAFFLILAGVVLGNLLGLGLLWSQAEFGWIRLNPEDYFVQQAPVAWRWGRFLLINAGVIGVCTLFMLVPTLMISRISPIRAIRFD